MMPGMIGCMADAIMHSGRGIVTCFSRQFEGRGVPGKPGTELQHEIRFIGAAESWSYLRNVVGDAACMIRREAFDAIGGFTELQNVGKEDMEFFHTAMACGLKIEVVPEPLYYYRCSPDSMKKGQDNFEAGVLRAMRPHLANLPLPAADLIRHLSARYHPGQQQGPKPFLRWLASWRQRCWRS